MKNVTIKLENDVAHWSRIWAAEHNTSVSLIRGDLLKQMKQEKTGYTIAMQQFFDGEPQPIKKTGNYPSRNELSSALIESALEIQNRYDYSW